MAGCRKLKGAGQASCKTEISFSPSLMTVYNWGLQVYLYNTDLSPEIWPCLPPWVACLQLVSGSSH